MHAGHPVSLQLESYFCHSRTYSNKLFVSLARWNHQERTGCRIPESTQVAYQEAIARDFGWTESAPQQDGARVSGRTQRIYPIGISSCLCSRPESGGIFVGLAQETRVGQLLSSESWRVAHQRPQQTQECAKTSLDHCSLLDAGYALVVS